MHTQETLYAEALNNAIASVEIEGYDVSELQKEFCLDFIIGKMNKEEFIKTILERCKI